MIIFNDVKQEKPLKRHNMTSVIEKKKYTGDVQENEVRIDVKLFHKLMEKNDNLGI